MFSIIIFLFNSYLILFYLEFTIIKIKMYILYEKLKKIEYDIVINSEIQFYNLFSYHLCHQTTFKMVITVSNLI